MKDERKRVLRILTVGENVFDVTNRDLFWISNSRRSDVLGSQSVSQFKILMKVNFSSDKKKRPPMKVTKIRKRKTKQNF